MKQNKQIDEHVSQLLKAHEATPALSSFDAVLARLQRKRRKRFFWIFFTGLGLCGSIYMAYYQVTQDKNAFAEKTVALQQAAAVKEELATLPKAGTKKQPVKNPEAVQKNLPALSQPAGNDSPANDQKRSLKETILKTGKEKTKAQEPVPGNDHALQSLPSAPAAANTTFEKQPAVITVKEQPVNSTPVKNDPVNNDQNLQSTLADETIHLNPVTPVFLFDSKETEAFNPLPLQPLANDSLNRKNKRPYKLYLGISFNPQIANYFAHKNPGLSSSATKLYLQSKKDQAKFRFTYGFGLRFGLVYKDKWEFLAGFGYQQYNYYEKSPPFSTIGINTGNGYNYNTHDPSIPDKDGFKTTLNYSSYSLDAARIIRLRSLIKINAGAGLQFNRLFESNYNTNNARRNVLTPHIKAGLIYDIAKNIQLQLCPDLYCSASSILNKNSVIRQNSYGIGLEGLLLFKIR